MNMASVGSSSSSSVSSSSTSSSSSSTSSTNNNLNTTHSNLNEQLLMRSNLQSSHVNTNLNNNNNNNNNESNSVCNNNLNNFNSIYSNPFNTQVAEYGMNGGYSPCNMLQQQSQAITNYPFISNGQRVYEQLSLSSGGSTSPGVSGSGYASNHLQHHHHHHHHSHAAAAAAAAAAAVANQRGQINGYNNVLPIQQHQQANINASNTTGNLNFPLLSQ